MAVQIQFRRGNTAQHSVFTGVVGEVTVDTDRDILVVHDGSTVGGFPLAPIFTYDLTNTAFNQANTGTGIATASFGKANDAYTIAVAAFDTANNSGIGIAAYGQANIATTIAEAAFDTANNSAIGIAAYDQANIATTIAEAAFDTANTKFSSSGGTINGSVSISGNLVVSGNTSFINVQNYRVDDPLIYLAANNYTSDVVDIGLIGNYSNGACTALHTGIFRDAGTKEWYVFENYSEEPYENVIDPNGNNFTVSVLNATIKTSNIILGGQNTIIWLNSAYDKANAANVLAYNTGIGSNAFASATIAGANAAVGAGANAYSDTVGTSANAFTSATISGANTAVGSGANAYADIVGTSANAFASATIAGANTAVGAGANAFTSATVAGANVISIAAFNQANAAYEKANSGGVSSNAISQIFVANGAQTTFLLSNNVSQQNNTIVSVDGLLQIPGIHYSISGSNLVFTTEPLNKSNVEIRVFSTTSTILGVIDGNVTVYLSDVYNYTNLVGSAANSYTNTSAASINAYTNSVTSAVGIAANTISIAAFNKANSALSNTSGASFEGNLNFPKGNVAVGNANTSYIISVNGIEVGFRNIPWSGNSDKTSAYTLSRGDIGEFVSIGVNGSIIIPTNTFSAGDIISMFNNTANTINITCNAVNTYVAGNNNTRTSLVLSNRGLCTAFFYSSNVCIVSGNIV